MQFRGVAQITLVLGCPSSALLLRQIRRGLTQWRILGATLGGLVKILLVEDSKFLRVSTERALTGAGYEVICAIDGEQALKLARESPPGLILLDMMLPKMSGPDVLKKLKEDPATAAIPVMVLSGLSQKNSQQLQRDGADGFFEKSDSMLGKGPGALLTAVAEMLKKKE